MQRSCIALAKHEFTLLEEVDNQLDYAEVYLQLKPNCIAVDDNWLERIWQQFAEIPSYIHSLQRPGQGFNVYGVTLFPPASLSRIAAVCTNIPGFQQDQEGTTFLNLLHEGMVQNSYLLHYGI